jgi:hypothetical protein
MSGPWGIPLPSGRWRLFSGLFGFVTVIISKIIGWLIIMKTTGALARVGIYMAALAGVTAATVGLVVYVNNTITGIINGLSPLGLQVVSGITSMFPTNLPYYITIIMGYYVFSITTHITIEIVKFKAKVADEASKRFIA